MADLRNMASKSVCLVTNHRANTLLSFTIGTMGGGTVYFVIKTTSRIQTIERGRNVLWTEYLPNRAKR